MRNDSVLLTGMNSSTISKVERNREKERLKKEATLKVKNAIHPSIEPILEELKKEKDRTTLEILELVDGKATEDVQMQIKALKLYRESMDALKSRLSTIMRAKPELKDESKDD